MSSASDYRILRDAADRMRDDGIQRGNADLADSCQWTPPGEPERPTLPGHEHEAPLNERTWRQAA